MCGLMGRCLSCSLFLPVLSFGLGTSAELRVSPSSPVQAHTAPGPGSQAGPPGAPQAGAGWAGRLAPRAPRAPRTFPGGQSQAPPRKAPPRRPTVAPGRRLRPSRPPVVRLRLRSSLRAPGPGWRPFWSRCCAKRCRSQPPCGGSRAAPRVRR